MDHNYNLKIHLQNKMIDLLANFSVFLQTASCSLQSQLYIWVTY